MHLMSYSSQALEIAEELLQFPVNFIINLAVYIGVYIQSGNTKFQLKINLEHCPLQEIWKQATGNSIIPNQQFLWVLANFKILLNSFDQKQTNKNKTLRFKKQSMSNESFLAFSSLIFPSTSSFNKQNSVLGYFIDIKYCSSKIKSPF